MAKTQYKIISAKDFVKAHPTGELNLEQSKQVLRELASIAQPPADYEILLDIREVNEYSTEKFNYTHLYELVGVLVENRQSFRNKLAILARDDEQLDKARFLELCASNRGFLIEVFTTFEDAIGWLVQEVEIER